MSKVSSLFFSLLVAAGATFAAGVPELDLPKEIPDEPFDITAARIEYTNDTLIASGGVTGRFENATLIADRVSGKPETGDIHAEGDIYFERENVIWQGTELEYNYITQDGDFGPSSLNFDPILVSVEHVERVSTNEFMLKNAEFTTCQREHPHFNVRAKEARLIDQEYLKAKGVTVYVGRVPIFYLPYWRQKLSRSIFEFSMGNSSELGIYGLVKATVPVTENVDWISDLNLYSRRGVGFGQGVEWEFPHSIGEFSSFYIKDEDPNAKYGTDSDIGQLIDDDRYRFKFGGIHNFDDTHYINTKLNYLSDPAVLREFLRDEYRSYAQPENYASWVYGTRYVGTEALASYRLNDFYDNTDRAEYSLDLYRTRIPGTSLYVQSENSIASLERVHKTYDPSAGDYDSVRLDSMNSVFLPYRVGFLSFVPRATCRTTYYSKSEEFGEQFRTIPGFGMETLFQANKVLSDRERWYGKGLRHKIEPYTDIIWEDSSVNPEDLYQFDSVDRLRDEEKIKVGLRNVLLTK
ncbi:MAG: hypothetical protein OES84_02610, partial [Kiritimatiellaceae bacterium]|nr:hypothetical protein [Kiritimatiellaceae bacterium]